MNVSKAKAAGTGIYDDTDVNWVYTGTWSALTGLTGPTNGTLHRGDVVGAKASFTFTGTQFILTYTQNTNRENIEVRVDGNLVTTINANGALQFQKTYTSPVYASGVHTVEFTHTGSVGTVIDVDSIEILATTTPGVGVYDDAATGWTYTGTWSVFTGLTGPTNGTLHRGDAVGAKASFAFTGTQFILTYTQNTNRGTIEVRVDGNLVTTINANGALLFQKTYTSPVFTSGVHTVEFTHTGSVGTYIDVDSIEVLATAAPGVGVYDDAATGWAYTGTWSALTGLTGPTNGTLHRGDAVGAKASFTFTGTQFILTYTQNTNRGTIEVRVDGNLVTTINANGALLFQQTYTSPVYASGVHTVEFTHTGSVGTYIDVDSIQIIDAGGSSEPDLTLNMTHSGSGFEQGDLGRTFTVEVTNSGGAITTSDPVEVVVALPSGLTATGISGTGWNCTLGTLTCTRNDPIEDGAGYPSITVTVNVADEIVANSLTGEVSVNGGGETNTSNNTDSDEVTILKPDLVILDYHLTNASNAVIANPLPDETFNIIMTVKNQGTAATGTFYPGVFLDDQPNYGPDTVNLAGDPDLGRVSDWSGYRRTPVNSVSNAGCMYYDPTDTIDPLVTSVDNFLERGNYTRLGLNSSLEPGAQDTISVSISYPESDYTDPVYDGHRTGLPAGTYSAYLYVDPNCSGGKMEIDESNNSYPINFAVNNTGSGGAGVGIYDDADGNWTYTGTWSVFTGLTGPTNGTLHRGDAVGAKASFAFTGTQFILTYTQNTNRGNIEVRVDGNLVTTINANGALQFQKTYTSPVYASGVHTVEFTHTGSVGTVIDVDSIEILATAAPGVGVYDDAATGWTYTGTWSALTGLTGPTNGTLHRGDAVGAKASFTFTGTQFILKYTQNTNRGTIEVRVDGNLVTTINANGALQFQKTYTSPIFTSGVHTVEFTHTGSVGTYIDVDSIEILATAAPGVGVYDDAATGWTYTGTWSVFTGLTGPTNGTLHRGDVVGAKASFAFTGTQFILKYTQNTNRGNIEVRVDGNLVTTINANGALQYQKTYTSPVYASGVHTVEFTHTGSVGTYIDVDSIEVLATAAPGVGVYDDAATGWAYTGTWSALTGLTGPTNGTLHRGDAVGAKASFTFTGTQFILTYTQNTNRGTIEVRVDGNLVTTINANGALLFQQTYTSPVFTSGVHTVAFTHTGSVGTYIDVDSIQIP